MRVLLTGAHGFIGSYVAAALRRAGHEVVSCVRAPRRESEIACDLARDTDTEVWLPRLAGVDAVVNCAGILRETGSQTFAAIHVDAPVALFRACAQARVRKAVQISALGEPADGEFIASKHRADVILAGLDLDWTILRPGLVYSASGSYGGTSLLRALSVLPGIFFLPGRGEQKMRPVAAEDVGEAVAAALSAESASRQVIEFVGPQTLRFVDYLRAWRAWFGLPPAFELHMPLAVVDLTVAAGEGLTRGPVCRVIWNLLRRQRIGADGAVARIAATLRIAPRSLETALGERTCRDEDRQAAKLYTLLPSLRSAFALLWVASGCVGLLAPGAQIAAAVPGWPLPFAGLLAKGTSIVDIALGLMLLCKVRTRLVETLMLVMLLGYTAGIALFAPQHWLDPFGGLLKNFVLIVALMLLLALEKRA